MYRFILTLIILAISTHLKGQQFKKDPTTGLYYLSSSTGKPLTGGRFFEVRPFKNGKAWVRDTTGIWVFKNDSQDLSYLFRSVDFGQWGQINQKGKFIIPPQFHYLDTLFNGYHRVGIRQHHYKWVIQDLTKSEPTYEEIPEKPGMIPMGGIQRSYDLPRSPMYYGLLNEKGNIVLPVKYYAVGHPVQEKVLIDRGKDPESQRPLILVNKKLGNPPLGLTRFVLVNLKDGAVKPLPYSYIYERGEMQNMDNLPIHPIQKAFHAWPEFYIVEKTQNDTNFYGIMNASGNLIAPVQFFMEVQEVVNIMNDPNNFEDLKETAFVYFQPPKITYDSILDQHFCFLENNKILQSIILNGKGEILFQSDSNIYLINQNTDGILTFGRNQLQGTPQEREIMSSRTKDRPNWKMLSYALWLTPPLKDYPIVTERLNVFKNQNGYQVELNNIGFYTSLTPMERNLYLVSKDNHYGFCDSNGVWILPVEYTIRDTIQDGDFYENGFPLVTYSIPQVHFSNGMEGMLINALNRKENYKQEWILLDKNNKVRHIWKDAKSVEYNPEKSAYKVIDLSNKITWFKP